MENLFGKKIFGNCSVGGIYNGYISGIYNGKHGRFYDVCSLQLSSVQNPCRLMIIRDYTTQ